MTKFKNLNHVIAAKQSEHVNTVSRLANVLGTLPFIKGLAIFFISYVAINFVTSFFWHMAFDSYPFLFISTIINLYGAFTTSILLAADKAQQERDSIRNDHDHATLQTTLELNESILNEIRALSVKNETA